MTTRRILRLTGSDARDFLQGLITNDVAKVDQGLVYAALLTPQGKYLADFFVFAEGDDLLIDVDESLAASLAKRLSMYRLRADVQISDTDLQVKRGTGPAPEGALMDPRHDALGWRLYGAEGGDDGSNWDAIRVAHCIPQTGIELGPDSYILEAGVRAAEWRRFPQGLLCWSGSDRADETQDRAAQGARDGCCFRIRPQRQRDPACRKTRWHPVHDRRRPRDCLPAV